MSDERLSVPAERAERFLERWANETIDVRKMSVDRSLPVKEAIAKLSPEDKKLLDKFTSFYRRFEDLLPTHGAVLPERQPVGIVDLLWRVDPTAFLFEAQQELRKAWVERSPLLREGLLMLLAGSYMRWNKEEPQMDRFLVVLLHALKRAHLLKYCLNPECAEPYFVAGRISQDYCGPECAKHGQRQSQLRWWHEQGDKRRKERVKKERAKKRGKGK